jgi:hypothetical protein
MSQDTETSKAPNGDDSSPSPCSGLSCTTARIQRENEQRRVIQKNTIADLLITHDIIHALSIEDAEGYDNFETSDNVMRFTQELESLLFPNDKVSDGGTPFTPPSC